MIYHFNFATMKKSKNGKIQISVQCHPSLVKEVRNYAKQRTIEELKKEEKL